MSVHVIKATAAPSTVPTRTGVHYVDTLAKKHYFSVGTSTLADWVEIGTGSGSGASGGDAGINHILRGSADSGIDGWNLYKDAAAALPVDATQGGNLASITFTQNTTSPLRGTADFRLTKPASNLQGEGVSYDFTIPRADLGRVLTISFEYEVVSGTYATGDLTAYIIQDTTGTPSVIQPSAFRIEAVGGTTKGRFIGVFQTHASVLNYRLAFHVATTSALAYTLGIDRISVGPQTVQIGTPVTDWQSYTPTFTNAGTVTGIEFQYRRVGDNLQIKGKFTAGTPVAAEARVSLPAGLSAAGTDRIPTIQVSGQMYLASATNQFVVLQEPSVSYATFGLQNGSSNPLTKQNGTAVFASGVVYSVRAETPILGWSSSTQMSNDTDTRVVAAKIIQTASQSITNNVVAKATNMSPEFDRCGLWNSSLQRLVIQSPGTYRVTAACPSLSGSGDRLSAMIYKNGALALHWYIPGTAVGAANPTGSGLMELIAGDYLELYVGIEGASRSTNPGTGNFYLAVERLSGPSAIAASENIALAVGSSSGQVIPSGVETTILYNVIKKDSHGSYNPSTGIWTCATPGFYYFFSSASFGTAVSDTNSWTLQIQRNGAVLYYQTINKQTAAFAAIIALVTGGGEQLLVGDQIRVRASQDTGTGRGLSNNPASVHLSIFKVGL